MPVQKISTAFENAVAQVISDAKEGGVPLTEVCRGADVSRATLYRWADRAPEQVRAIDRLRKSLRQSLRRRGKELADD